LPVGSLEHPDAVCFLRDESDRVSGRATPGRTKPLNFNEIPPFPICCAEMTVSTGRKFLSEQEFSVVVFAATGIPARSRRVAKARLTFAVEWSDKGKKTILHQNCCGDCCNPKLRY